MFELIADEFSRTLKQKVVFSQESNILLNILSKYSSKVFILIRALSEMCKLWLWKSANQVVGVFFLTHYNRVWVHFLPETDWESFNQVKPKPTSVITLSYSVRFESITWVFWRWSCLHFYCHYYLKLGLDWAYHRVQDSPSTFHFMAAGDHRGLQTCFIQPYF